MLFLLLMMLWLSVTTGRRCAAMLFVTDGSALDLLLPYNDPVAVFGSYLQAGMFVVVRLNRNRWTTMMMHTGSHWCCHDILVLTTKLTSPSRRNIFLYIQFAPKFSFLPYTQCCDLLIFDWVLNNHSVFVHPIHDDIQPPSDPHTVRYLHLSESPDQYSMGIFVFPPFARIPLHDHPGMCVLSRVLYGTLQRLSLDLARDQPLDENDHDDDDSDDIDEQEEEDDDDHIDDEEGEEEDGDDMDVSEEHGDDTIAATQKLLLRNNSTSVSASSALNAATLEPSRVNPRSSDSQKPSQPTKSVSPHAWWSQYLRHHHHLPAGTKLAYQTKAIDSLQAPDFAILFPYEGNLHEFVAGPTGAAVLDVLLPPYDVDGRRDCTFYEVRDCTSKEQAMLRTMLVAANERGGGGGEASQYKQAQAQTSFHRHAFAPNQNAAGPAAALASSPTPCWIIPTGQPEDFHCISGTYNGLGCSPAVDDNNESIEYHA